MYDLIKNPNTNRYVSIHSNLGRSVLRNYLYTSQIGGDKLSEKIKNAASAVTGAPKKLSTKMNQAASTVTGAPKKLSTKMNQAASTVIDTHNKIKEGVSNSLGKLTENVLNKKRDFYNKVADNTQEKLNKARKELTEEVVKWNNKKNQEQFNLTQFTIVVLKIMALNLIVVAIWKEAFVNVNFYAYMLTYSYKILNIDTIDDNDKIKLQNNDNALMIVAIYIVLLEMLNLFNVIQESLRNYKEHAEGIIKKYQNRMETADPTLKHDYKQKNFDKIATDMKFIQKMILEMDGGLAIIESLPAVKSKGVDILLEAYDKDTENNNGIKKLISSVNGISPFNAKSPINQ